MNVRRIIRDAVLLAVQEEAGLYSKVVDDSDVRVRLGFNDYTWKVVSKDDEDSSPDVMIQMLMGVVLVSVVWYGGLDEAGPDGECTKVERVMDRLMISDPDFFEKLTEVVGSLGCYYHGVKF